MNTTFEEMRRRILAALEEAGSDRLYPLLNTVIDPVGRSVEVVLFEDALRDLVIKGEIIIQLTSIPHGDQPLTQERSLDELSKLSAHYHFDTAEGIWLDDRFESAPYFQKPEPEAKLTALGRTASLAIVERHGSNWWQRR